MAMLLRVPAVSMVTGQKMCVLDNFAYFVLCFVSYYMNICKAQHVSIDNESKAPAAVQNKKKHTHSIHPRCKAVFSSGNGYTRVTEVTLR